jgi:hypothetical protein
MTWWEKKKKKSRRALAYYRHSAQNRQKNSIEIQRRQVREFAERNNIEIVCEYSDAGVSGLRGCLKITIAENAVKSDTFANFHSVSQL